MAAARYSVCSDVSDSRPRDDCHEYSSLQKAKKAGKALSKGGRGAKLWKTQGKKFKEMGFCVNGDCVVYSTSGTGRTRTKATKRKTKCLRWSKGRKRCLKRA